MGGGVITEAKQRYGNKLCGYMETYDTIIIVNIDRVGSNQIAKIRHSLRGKAEVLMGKNTTIRTILEKQLTEHPQYKNLIDGIRGNCGFIFCQDDVTVIKDIISDNKVPAPARQGLMAPSDVFVPPGPTGMDPSQTSFFQAMGIATKVVKGQIEIQNEIQIISKDQKVSASAATLLQKLNIKPFFCEMQLMSVYDAGDIYSASALDINTDHIVSRFKMGVSHAAAFSLLHGFPTAASANHSIIKGFRYVAAFALANNHTFKQLQDLQTMSVQSSPQTAPDTKTAPPVTAAAAAPPPAEESESEGDMGFGLFD